MNITVIKQQLDELASLYKRSSEAQNQKSVLEGKSGQDTCHIVINGVSFNVTELNKYYLPEVIKGMEIIQKEAVKLKEMQIATIKGKIEGLEFTIRNLTKA